MVVAVAVAVARGTPHPTRVRNVTCVHTRSRLSYSQYSPQDATNDRDAKSYATRVEKPGLKRKGEMRARMPYPRTCVPKKGRDGSVDVLVCLHIPYVKDATLARATPYLYMRT